MSMTSLKSCLALAVVASSVFATPLAAQTSDGAGAFQKACASCHLQTAADSRAPSREVLAQLAPETILTALTTGNMFQQGAALTDAERRAVSAFLAGRPVGTAAPLPMTGRCTTTAAPLTAAALRTGWNGWGAGGGSERTLVIVLQRNCSFCLESMPFYRGLVANRGSARDALQLVVVAPSRDGDVASYLASMGMQPDIVAYDNGSALPGVRVTPTLLLADPRGVVLEEWTSKLSETEGQRLLGRLFPSER
jgi:cytochrome c553